MTAARRFPFGHEPTTPRVEIAPVAERLTMPLVESDAPTRPVLPFRAPLILPPPAVLEAPPPAAAALTPSRARRWLRLAAIVLGLLFYVGVLLGIAAPESWWR